MDPNLKKIRDSVIEHTLKLDNDQLALLLLIQLSRHQNLFIHEPSVWEDIPTECITKGEGNFVATFVVNNTPIYYHTIVAKLVGVLVNSVCYVE